MSNCVAQVFKRALALILCCGYPTIHAAQEQGPSLTEINNESLDQYEGQFVSITGKRIKPLGHVEIWPGRIESYE